MEASPEQALGHGQQIHWPHLRPPEARQQRRQLAVAEQHLFPGLGRLAAQAPPQTPQRVERPVVRVGLSKNQRPAGLQHPHQLGRRVRVFDGVMQGRAGIDEIELARPEAGEVARVPRHRPHPRGHASGRRPPPDQLDRRRGQIEQGRLGALGRHHQAPVSRPAPVIEDRPSRQRPRQKQLQNLLVHPAALPQRLPGVGQIPLERAPVAHQRSSGGAEMRRVLAVVELALLAGGDRHPGC